MRALDRKKANALYHWAVPMSSKNLKTLTGSNMQLLSWNAAIKIMTSWKQLPTYASPTLLSVTDSEHN